MVHSSGQHASKVGWRLVGTAGLSRPQQACHGHVTEAPAGMAQQLETSKLQRAMPAALLPTTPPPRSPGMRDSDIRDQSILPIGINDRQAAHAARRAPAGIRPIQVPQHQAGARIDGWISRPPAADGCGGGCPAIVGVAIHSCLPSDQRRRPLAACKAARLRPRVGRPLGLQLRQVQRGAAAKLGAHAAAQPGGQAGAEGGNLCKLCSSAIWQRRELAAAGA